MISGHHNVAVLALCSLFCATVPAVAHHGFAAEFSSTKLLKVTGVLTKVEWRNPHAWFYVNVKDENGNVVNWGFETSSPIGILHEYPSARRDFFANIGKQITVVACPAKGILHRGSSESVKLANGTILRVGMNYSGSEKEEEILLRAK